MEPQQQLAQMQAKLKNYQLHMDCLFLAACQGIVDNDMTHLNMYVSAGGDLTRYLTSDECAMLSRPQIFTVGLTLLHLCYQFKRKDLLIKILNKSSSNNNNNNNNNKLLLLNNNNNTPSPSSHALSTLFKQVSKTKFSPCQSCPSLASNIIDRYFSASLRQRKTPAPPHKPADHHMSRFASSSDGATCHSSPTSSLISLNGGVGVGANNAVAPSNGAISVGSALAAFGATSPSPSPPPYGATSSSFYRSSSNSNQTWV